MKSLDSEKMFYSKVIATAVALIIWVVLIGWEINNPKGILPADAVALENGCRYFVYGMAVHLLSLNKKEETGSGISQLAIPADSGQPKS